LLLKPTSLSCPQSLQRSRRKPCAQDAALEKRIELVLDGLRQAGTGALLGSGEEGLGALLHQAVQRGLLGTVALAVDRRATTRPVRLPTDDLYALLPLLARPQARQCVAIALSVT